MQLGEQTRVCVQPLPPDLPAPIPSPAPAPALPLQPLPPFKPIVIPQVTSSFDSEISSPFIRSYSPTLNHLGIPISTFTTFIDGLNEVWIANPVLQATSVAGEIMACFPMLEIPGTVLTEVSDAGSEAGSYFRTKQFLKKAVEGVFEGRKIGIKIVGVEDMLCVVGAQDGVLEGLKGEGKDSKKGRDDAVEITTSELEELAGVVDDGGSDIGTELAKQSPGLLLLEKLWGQVSELQTDGLPPLSEDSNMLKRWNAKYAAYEGRKQEQKQDKKHCEAKGKKADKYQAALKIAREQDREIVRVEDQIERMQHSERGEKEIERRIASLLKERDRLRKRRADKIRGKINDGDGILDSLRKKELKKATKIKYLVIYNPDEVRLPTTKEKANLWMKKQIKSLV